MSYLILKTFRPAMEVIFTKHFCARYFSFYLLYVFIILLCIIYSADPCIYLYKKPLCVGCSHSFTLEGQFLSWMEM